MESIVILTGAGVSAESGLPTFRGASGALWHGHRPEAVATPEAFRHDPQLVHRFYNERRRQYLTGGVEPNVAHRALARLQREFSGSVFLVTQNIDSLHERAGSRQVCHMHGELTYSRCGNCENRAETLDDIGIASICGECGHAGALRPDVVWFGEMPYHLDLIEHVLSECDLFVAAGTSGVVYPAAGFVELAREQGAHTIEINLEPSAVRSHFAEHRTGPAGELLPDLVDALLAAA